MATLAVVIPALNEAERLPALLRCLAAQSQRPTEVIVADAGSTDTTRELAAAAGAVVVDGGMPAAGRNAGARAATSDLLLFLDADVDLEPDFISTALAEFSERELCVSTAYVEPIEGGVENAFACDVVNLYLDLMQYVVPHAPGFCILVQREAHESIGGFDETLALAEDHDYVQRAAKCGKFRILRSMPVRTSMRRIEKEGLVRLSFKYLYSELFVVTGRPIHSTPFEYEFAAFDAEAPQSDRSLLGGLTAALGGTADAVRSVSAGALDTLVELGSRDVESPAVLSGLVDAIPSRDFDALRRYVEVRARLARRRRTAVLARVRAVGDRAWSELTRW